MAVKKGERYRCPDPECGCEVEMTKGLHSEKVEIRTGAALRKRDEACLMSTLSSSDSQICI